MHSLNKPFFKEKQYFSGLSRQRRRRVDREVRRLIQQDGDYCSVCRAAFPHNSQTFIGTTAAGATALVGACCVERLEWITGSGLYLSHDYGVLAPRAGAGKGMSFEQIGKAIAAHQKYFEGVDQFAAGISKKAGLPIPGQANLGDAPWKEDDAAWFKNHPRRSHRVRSLYPGELVARGRKAMVLSTGAAFSEADCYVLLRQVQPGTRVGLVIYLNCNIPNVESIGHSLFDLAARGGWISGAELTALIDKYQTAEESGVVS